MYEHRHHAVWPARVPRELELPATSLFDNLAVSALRYPQHAAIHYYGSSLSYAQLLEQAEHLAGHLQAAGVARGERVLLYMQNSPQYIIGFYAILRAGAVVVPVNPMNRSAELRYLLEDTGAALALCGQELLESIVPLIGEHALREVIVSGYAEYLQQPTDLALPEALLLPPLQQLPAGVRAWQAVLAQRLRPAAVDIGPDDLAVIPYSSGTTGNPKGCTHSHRSVMATAVYSSVWTGAQHDMVSLVSVPMFHVTGMQSCMNAAIYVGATSVVMTRWDRRVAAQLIERCRVTVWRNISTMVVDLLGDPQIEQFDLSSLKAIGGGGAAMPAAVVARLRERMGLDYMEGYGLSETISATHINPPEACKPQCLGIPIIGTDARVIDVDTLQEVGPRVTGEIVMRGPQVMLGYWNRPQDTAEAFLELEGERFFRSGDLGYYDEQGYFFLVDRVKRMINASGYKVWPAEVESLMYGHPALREVCIISVPHPRRGETVKAVAVRAAGHEQVSGEEILAWCQQQMAAYKCPQMIEFVEALPKSATGKVLWRQLQEQEWQALRG